MGETSGGYVDSVDSVDYAVKGTTSFKHTEVVLSQLSTVHNA